MTEKGISMYGAFWCPHCSRQKELFGAEAWSYIDYVECSPKGYGFKGICKNVDGYPTFMDKRRKVNFSGERSLGDLAQQVGFTAFDPCVTRTRTRSTHVNAKLDGRSGTPCEWLPLSFEGR